MAEQKEVKVPDIGADEVDVIGVLVNVGDKIEPEQSLIEVEGDKASMEVPAPFAGTVKEIKIKEGSKVKEGTLIMIVEAAEEGEADSATSAESADDNSAEESAAPAATAGGETVDVHVPDIGDDEVDVINVMVSVGDKIEAEQSVIEVEGDKASMEVPAPFAGTVKEVLISVGDKVTTGKLILRVEQGGSDASAEQAAPAPAEASAEESAVPAAAEVVDVNVPDIGADEVDVINVMVSVGDTIEAEQSVIEVEGDKASMEVPAPFAGTVKEVLISEGDKVTTGKLILRVEKAGAPAKANAAPAKAPAAQPEAAAKPVGQAPKAPPVKDYPATSERPHATVHASPSVRRLAREFGVDLTKVKGSGRKQRILKEDVQAYVKEQLARPSSSGSVSSNAGGNGLSVLDWPRVDFSKFGEVERVEMSRIQKISGPNLHRNWVTIPHVTQFDEADITELEAFRKQQNAVEAKKKEGGIKITPLAFIMKAAAKALVQYPKFNSSIDPDGDALFMKKYVHIGVAVDTPNGLVVPVIRDVDKKGIYELSQDLMAVSKKARAGKLTGADMQGSSFTISSLGGIGGTQFTPIVNAPDVAILGVSKSATKPVWDGNAFQPRLMLPLALSYDHRVIDGADGARFITALNGNLSDLRRIIL